MKKLGQDGQSLVEFALVVPILLVLIIGIAEFGRAWMTRNIMTGAAREAVRIAAVRSGSGTTDNTFRDRADAVLSSAGITGATVALGGDGLTFGTVTVTVSYEFPVVLAGFVPGLTGNFPLSSSTTMRREY